MTYALQRIQIDFHDFIGQKRNILKFNYDLVNDSIYVLSF